MVEVLFMNCRRSQRWLSEELDGALKARRARALAEHLKTCPACRAFQERCLLLRSLTREAVPAPKLSAEAMWAEVRRRIHAESATVAEDLRWKWNVWIPVAAAASLFAMVFCGAVALWRAWESWSGATPMRRAQVEWVETSLPGATPMVYQDEETGWVVIWVVEANGFGEKDHADS